MKRLLPLLVAVCVALAFAPVADAGAPAPNPPHAPPPQGPIYEPAAPVPVLLDPDTIVHGDAGGYFSGASEVTPAGQFAWHTSLVLPPGLAQPALSIDYISGGGNGLLGVGFSLSGLSEISRCGQVFAIDKKATPADHTENSRFCLDGKRLIVVKGAYGEDGSEYRTEEDSFRKVVYKAGGAAVPSSFSVWTKDGHSARYEALRAFRAAPSAVAPFAFQPVEEVDVAWPLVETTDRAENRIRYHYKTIPPADPADTFTLEYYPDSIEYTLRKGEQEGRREVRFLFEKRPDPSFAFVGGVRLKNTKRLSSIELYAPNPIKTELIGTYELSYLTSAATKRSLLKTINRCDADANCQWGKRFQWQTDDRPDFEEVDLGPEVTANQEPIMPRRTTGGWGEGIRGGGPRASTKTRAP